jgi:nitrite reductase (NADH) small subunit
LSVIIEVGPLEKLPVNRFQLFEENGIEFGLMRGSDKVYAVRNICPHQGAPICLGTVRGTWLPSPPGELDYGLSGHVLACPWHGFEFGLDDGKALFGTIRGKLRIYPVTVKDGTVFVNLKT